PKAGAVDRTGVVLYDRRSGNTRYRLTTPSPREVEKAVTEQEPTRPSTVAKDGNSRFENRESGDSRFTKCARPARTDSRALRGDLDNILLMALRKEPARRYQSVEQFSEDIRR